MYSLPKNFTTRLFGKEMLKDFNDAYDEGEVEDIYKHNYSEVSKSKIKTIKRKLPSSRAKTDGILEFSYNGKKAVFYGLQEVKYKKAGTDWQIKQQLIQALMYNWMFEQSNSQYKFDVFILNSESYFAYIYDDELVDVKRILWSIFPLIAESPSVAYKNELVKKAIKGLDIPFRKDKITSEYAFHEVIRDIYKRCIR